MAWLWLLVPALIVVFALTGAVPPAREDRAWEHIGSDDGDASDRVADDPLDTLLRYGTQADAERLIDAGYGEQLEGLGYRPPSRD